VNLLLLVLAASPMLELGEAPISHPAPLPAEVLAALVAQNRVDLEQCDSSGPFAKYFAATPLDVDGDGTNDLVITTGAYCLDGAHARPYWLFLKTKTGWAQRFPETGREIFDGFTVLATKHHGLRDVVTQNHTAVQMFTAHWNFDGTRYVATTCWEESVSTKGRKAVPCR
jgi:hypothetical protein